MISCVAPAPWPLAVHARYPAGARPTDQAREFRAEDARGRDCHGHTPDRSRSSSVQTLRLRHAKNQMAATASTATMATTHVKPPHSPGGPAATPAPGGVPPPPVPLPVACARADEAVRRMKPTSVVNSEWRIRAALRRAGSEVTSTPRDAWPFRWSQPKKRPVVRQAWRSGATDEHGANPRSPVRVSSL